MNSSSAVPAALEPLIPMNGVAIAASKGRGRGVFATRAFDVGDVIAIDPVLHFDERDTSTIATTRLRDYYYVWKSDRDGCICLGFGSLYNHSYQRQCRIST